MEHVVPWAELCALVEPFYPKNDRAGQPVIGLERMLRIRFLQHGILKRVVPPSGLGLSNDSIGQRHLRTHLCTCRRSLGFG